MKGGADFKSKGPELLVDLAQHTAVALTELLGIEPARAEQAGREIADRMAAHWGGQNIYFPMGLSYKLSQRDQQIYDAFNGTNHSDLARKYGVSLQWIYKIVKTVRQEETARRQGDMFT
ncbi:Mor family transcriptional regulator [Microvirgula sp. AG722]|uniref:Mor transcription activator family protein n=1 Tax=Microvirgula sp. AG722 TaxID=2183901 RepID=UPI000DC205CB|nr:Mor transcription activator family protein [Microvirgula sp. AG722]RAS18902.1 Mor family transcriptional regulator [Microvirgula sp. AG722]